MGNLKRVIRGLTFSVTLIVVVLIGACGSISDIKSGAQTQMAGWTDTPTLDPTCAPFLVNTQPPLFYPSKLIVVLYQTESWDTTYADQSLQIIYNVIPSVISPGDYIQIFTIGQKYYEDAEVIAGIVGRNIERPGIPATPVAPAGWTPIPSPTSSNITFENIEGKARYEAMQTASVATATYEAQVYNCIEWDYSSKYGEIATSWAATQSAMISNYATQIQEAVSTYNQGKWDRPEPEQSMLFYSFSHATITFEAECSKFDRCILIVLSDFEDWRAPEVEQSLNINLSNVEVLAPLLTCRNINRPECSAKIAEWLPKFSSYGVRSVEFTDTNDAELWLISRIRR